MNKLILIILLLSSAVTFAQEQTYPALVQKQLISYKKTHPHISVTTVQYKGKTAYYFPARCCDLPSELYDENGNLICYPDGGFAGGDGKCPSFKFNETTKTNKHVHIKE